MSSVSVVSAATFGRQRMHRIAITDTSLVDGHICVQYLITPVPERLRSPTTTLHRGTGRAVDDANALYDCTIAYRRATRGDRIVGAVRVGPDVSRTGKRIRVLLNPLPHTEGSDDVLCELHLAIHRGAVRTEAIRCLRKPVSKRVSPSS
jgi:hypothetical protein